MQKLVDTPNFRNLSLKTISKQFVLSIPSVFTDCYSTLGEIQDSHSNIHPGFFCELHFYSFYQVRVFCPAWGGGVWHRQLEPVGHWQVRGHLGEWVRKGLRNPHRHSRWPTRATSRTRRLPGTIRLLFGAISHKNRLQTKLRNTGCCSLSCDVDSAVVRREILLVLFMIF